MPRAFLAAACLLAAAPAAAGPLVVAIDAGHGGRDRGGVVRGACEADIVLKISKKVADLFAKQPGYSPFLTRWADEFVPLSDRVLRSEEVGSRVFVSIHADKVARKKRRGVVVYIYGRNPRNPKGPSRAPEEKLLPPPPKEQVRRSLRLAESIRSGFGTRGLRTVHYVDKGAYAVLKSSTIPSVLIEVGNLRDQTEARMLADAKYQERLAKAIVSGIRLFLERD